MGVIEPLKKSKKTILKNVKLTEEESALIQENANKYANGNFSEWVRYAAIQLKPKKKDIQVAPPVERKVTAQVQCQNCNGFDVAHGADAKGRLFVCRTCACMWKPLLGKK
jgi:formylmethanofuran dehydrogenase subunit E